MASYLGITESVVQLVNNEDVHPDVTDLQGNSVLMYATRGDHPELIHFLVEAGASINNCNDCCCTPLGVALMRFVGECKGISVNEMTQALIPAKSMLRINSSLQNVSEWNLLSDSKIPNKINGPTRTPSKVIKPQISQKRIKSLLSLKEQSLKVNHKTQEKIFDENGVTGNNYFNESFLLYTNVMNQYISKVTLEYTSPSSGNPISYVFEVEDVTKYVIDNEVEEQKKIIEKNPKKVTSKALKEFVNGKGKLGNGTSINNKDNPQPLSEVDRTNTDTYERILKTINQLLKDGADPNLVRCPQPALFMAVSSGCSKLVKQLLEHGANVNEFYPHILGYRILDIVISYPLKNENLNIIKVLLENGADTEHRLPYYSASSTESLTPGPTLLHAVLAKTADTEVEEEIRRHMLDLLLTYNCNYLDQFNGRSAIDVVMTKRADIFYIFIKHSRVDLNAIIINQSNQSILTKMFTLSYFVTLENKQRLEIVTSLLLHGADPLSTCQNEDEIFDNVFVYAKKILDGCTNVENKHSPTVSKHSENKARKNGKNNDDKGAKHKTVVGDIDEYKQTLELVTDWARSLQIYRLRTNILKELIETVNKYKHRHWTMILKNIENKKRIRLWLTPKVGLEILTTIKQRNRRKNNYDKTILKNLLYILLYCIQDIKESKKEERFSVKGKNFIESEVNTLLREYKHNNTLPIETKSWVDSVLIADDTKFNVCFECAIPLNNQKIVFPLSRDISFSTDTCMKTYFHRNDCHPCEDSKFRQIIESSFL